MSTVFKTSLEVADEQIIEVPRGAEMLHAGYQHGAFCVWYRCEPHAMKEKRRIRIAGTGHPISDEPWQHIGSCFTDPQGTLVFHLFELPA